MFFDKNPLFSCELSTIKHHTHNVLQNIFDNLSTVCRKRHFFCPNRRFLHRFSTEGGKIVRLRREKTKNFAYPSTLTPSNFVTIHWKTECYDVIYFLPTLNSWMSASLHAMLSLVYFIAIDCFCKSSMSPKSGKTI